MQLCQENKKRFLMFLDFFNAHIYRNYRSLRDFCTQHGINYNSARQIRSGSLAYPGVLQKIKSAIKADLTNNHIEKAVAEINGISSGGEYEDPTN
jgi:hypothetical protein